MKLKNFSKILSDSFLSSGIGPEQLAKGANRQISTVMKWVSGTALPNTESLIKICSILKKHDCELVASFLVSRHIEKIPSHILHSDEFDWTKEFDIKESMLGLYNEPKFFDKSSDDQLRRFIEYVQNPNLLGVKVEEFTNYESSLLVLPKVNIEIIENWSEVTKAIAKDSKNLYELSWQKFEDLIARLLESFGWEIGPMARTKDGGVDILATKLVSPDIDFNMMVQCKKNNQNRKVGVDVVKNVWATKWEKGFHQAMIATTSTFTKGAVDKANKWGLELRDHNIILEYCRNYYESN